MKRILLTLMLAGLLVTAVQAAAVKNIDSPTAQRMLKDNSALYLIDVRTPQEYLQMRLPGAHLIPIDKFLARLGEVPTDKPLLIYCAVGARSSQVAQYLAGKGYPEVYDLRGGIEAWDKLYRLPVLKGAP